jgi:hypothetical protein
MEMSGVILGVVQPPTTGFHIVQKEGTNVLKKKTGLSRPNSLASVHAHDQGQGQDQQELV